LDRDGTIIADRHYLSDPAEVELLPNAAAGLRRLQALGLGLVVVTNQSGIGRGLFTRQNVGAVHERMNDLLAAARVRLDGIYICPHAPEKNCACRKPKAGLAKRAARELGFEIEKCFVIGDKECDVQLGRKMGAVALLVRTGYGVTEAQKPGLAPDYIVDDLREAARVIAARVGRRN
jgi:histidinol-phosphate phosphatase family protein